ncbi:Putative type II restriction endonuclease [Modestobacter italicus]|uniref:Type II restriction endonuclease n=1 Tax=Modestobacter italicus (strain DSM 44449 / CECT 9708 / BC 501) TaxID=2732864 RepID=I4F1M5_MODI5|nr:Putative type II restriction endonuclease [Modestobacter marinus]
MAGALRREGPASTWPLVASNAEELEARLAAGGHLLPLPKEPAALANVIEVDIVDFLLARLQLLPDAEYQRGSERGYPDLEVGGRAFGGAWHAIDVKVAQRARRSAAARPGTTERTQSRITLYTGNTYFRHPTLHWPGTFRPFDDYRSHADVIVIYTLTDSASRVADLEVIIQEPWRVGSSKRSSTTREYIGAVDGLDDLRAGRGEFATAEDFYRFWRRFPFRTSPGVQRIYERLVAEQRAELETLRAAHPTDRAERA